MTVTSGVLLTINDVSLNEGNAGTTNFTFTVSLSAPAPAGGVTFDIATADGTANAPGDYTSRTFTAQTIPAGSSTYTFTVLVNGDTVFEPNETFFVNVTNVTGATATDSQGLGTIQNDDVQTSLTINDVSLNEGNSGTTTFAFTVSLSNPAPAGGVTFDITTADGTANAPSDYVSQTLTGQTIPAGSSSYTFNVAVNGDTVIEPNETFFVNVTNVTGATVADGQGQGTIQNDDADVTAPVISYAPLPAKASASSSTLVVTVTDNVAVQSVSVNYTIGAGTLQTASCALASGSTYNCIINETGGDNQIVSYYVSATDTSGNTNRFPATSNDGYAIGSANIQPGTYDVLNVLSGSLAGDVVINTSFSYAGIINSNGGSLRIGCNATLDAGNPNKFINATIIKDFCAPQTFVYPLGNAPVPAANQLGVSTFYTPLTVNVTSAVNPSSLTVSMTDARMPGADPANSISRYWSLTESGSLTADLTFQYDASDVTGNEAAFKVIKNENGSTTSFENSTVNTTNHTATVTGISDFSLWSVGNLAPLAASASLGGRVLTADGLGIRNVALTISGGNLSEPRRILTGSFGYYQFDDLEVGQTYIITINSKRYVFKESVVIVSVQDNITDYDFVAVP